MKRRATGFTLAEMAIVLVVVGLLLTSVLSTVSTQVEARNIAETQSRLNQIKDALIGYAQVNGRLPCPADGQIQSGATGAGLEEVVDTTNDVCKTPATRYAVLPWATLGLPETDVWGRRFSYYVDQNFADSYTRTKANPNPSWGCGATAPVPEPTAPTSFGLCATGSLIVKTKTPAYKTGSDVSGIPAVIVSHGKNGYGAYTSSGQPYGTLPATTTDEYGNTPAGATSTYYSREQSPPPDGSCSDTAAGNFCEFDDLLAYIPANVLISRMVSAGRLP